MAVTMRDSDIWLHDFLQNKSVQIQQAGDVQIERILQGSEQLSFTLQLTDPKLAFIHEDQLVLCEGVYWVVDHFEEEHPGYRTIVCNCRWIELSWRTRVGVFSLLGRTPTQGLTTILTGTGWTVGSMPVDSDLYSMEEMDGTALSLLRRWAVVTGYEVSFNTVSKTVSFSAAVGQVRELGFRWGQSIKSIKRTFYPPPATRLYPVGANNLQISDVNPTGQPYIENYSFYMSQGLTETQARNLYRKDLIWVDERYLIAVNLYDAAVRRINKLSQPRVFYEADVMDLSRIMGGQQGFNPGDTMPVDDEVLGVLEQVRVTRTVQYPSEPRRDQVELGFLSNGMLDVSSGSTRDVNYADLIPIVDQNVELLTIAGSETNYGAISVTSTGSTILIAGSTFVGTATGTGTLRIRMVIDGTNVGEPKDIVFTAGQVEMSWPTFATDLAEGPHDVHWRAQVVSGSGTVDLPIGAGRSWVLIRGAVGIGTSQSPNQFISEELLEIMADAFDEMAWTEEWLLDITDSDDSEDINFDIEGETLPEFDDTDLPADFTEWEEEFTVEQEYAFGVFWRDNTHEKYEELADEISDEVPASCQEDDLVVVFLWHRTGADNITAPSGFTRIAQSYVDDGTFEQWSEVWTKTDDGSMAEEELTFEATILDRMGMMIAVIRNAEGGTVDVDVVETTNYIATFTNPGEELFPDVDVTDPFRLGVFFVSCAYAPGPPDTATYTIDFFAPINDVAPVATSADALDYGAELSSTDGDWTASDGSFVYQWRFASDGSTLPGNSDEATYTPLPEHEALLAGQDVYCEVTTSNTHGSTSADSNDVYIPLPRRATGGTTSDDGTLVYHTFTVTDDFELVAPYDTHLWSLPVAFTIDPGNNFGSHTTDDTDDVLGDTPVTVTIVSGEVVVSYDPFVMDQFAYDPITDIAWHLAHWADGPEALALGLSDGASIGTWPDEKGSRDLTAVGTAPLYRVASSDMNGKNAVDIVNRRMDHASFSGLSSYSIVQIFYLPNLSGGRWTDNQVSGGHRVISCMYSSGGVWQLFFGGTASQSAPASTGLHSMVAKGNGAGSFMRVDGASVYSGVNPGTGQVTGFQLGVGNTSNLKLAFFAVYPGDITADPEWANLQQWALDTYGVSL